MKSESTYVRLLSIIEPISIIVLFFISSVEYTIWLSRSPSVRVLYFIKFVFWTLLLLKYIIQIGERVLQQRWNDLFTKEFYLVFSILIISGVGFFAGQNIETYIIKKYNLYNMEYITNLEVIVTMIIYNLLLIVPCVWRMFNYKEWIIKHKANLTLIVYLFVWFWFGCFYFYQAQRSDDNCFIFNNSKPNINAAIDTLVYDKKLNTNETEILQEIISKDKYKIDYKKIKIDNNDSLITTKEIGEEWGKFYDTKLRTEGYTHYNLSFHTEGFVLPQNIIYDYNDAEKWSDLINKEYIKVDVNLYKLDEFSDGTVVNIRNSEIYNENNDVINKPSKVYTLLFDKESLQKAFNILDNNKYAHLYNILALSNTFLDYTCTDIYVMFNNLVYLPIWDFLYFSAMTITTVGYGDITPNTTLIRGAVMLEVLLGVIIIGVFVTFLTSDRNRK